MHRDRRQRGLAQPLFLRRCDAHVWLQESFEILQARGWCDALEPDQPAVAGVDRAVGAERTQALDTAIDDPQQDDEIACGFELDGTGGRRDRCAWTDRGERS